MENMELVESRWDLESLDKAYRHGFMAGMVGKAMNKCPYRVEVLLNAWEAGWQDGKDQFEIKYSNDQQEAKKP